MRIAEVIATFPPPHGGMGYVCYHNGLELARRGHDVTVFTLDLGRLSYDNDPGNPAKAEHKLTMNTLHAQHYLVRQHHSGVSA